MNGEASDDAFESLMTVAARTCYLHAALGATLPPEIEIERGAGGPAQSSTLVQPLVVKASSPLLKPLSSAPLPDTLHSPSVLCRAFVAGVLGIRRSRK